MKNNVVRLFWGALALVVTVYFAGPSTSANQLKSRERLAALSARVMTLSRDLQRDVVRGGVSRAEIANLAAERFAALKDAAENDPAVVLQATLPNDMLQKVPANLQLYFEKRADIEGELEVMEECAKTQWKTLYNLKQGGKSLSLHFSGEPKQELVTGSKIRVKGVQVGDTLVADLGGSDLQMSSVQVTASALPNTLGEHKVLVILVNFQDEQTQPYTTTQAADVAFNTTSNYYRENSYGQTWLTGDVYGWYTIPVSSTNCDTVAIATYAKQAASNAGANLAAYGHLVYAFPQNNGCGFTGRGSIGGSPGEVWINQYFDVSSVGHELGHNFGLFHSRSMDCGTAVIGGTCTTSEYGDVIDIMGGGASAHTNLFQKERLGWINSGSSPPLTTVTTSGTYWIDAYEPVGTNPKGLKVLKSTDPVTGYRTWYYAEHRTLSGFDSYMSNLPGIIGGVTIHTGSESSGQEIYLLDMTPATASWYDSSLLAGQSFTDPDSGMTITTLSADSTGAMVQVDLPSQPCAHANPSVTVTPGQTQWLSSGTTFNYSVSVTNNDGSGCSMGSFKLQANVASGWAASYSAPSLSLTPGGSSTVMLSVTSPVGASDGNYGVNSAAVNGTNSSYSGTASASYEIVTGLNVAATSGAASYTRTQKATVTAVVTAAGVPVSGAGVSFMMTKSNGQIVTQTATTDANGKAVFTYSFNRRTDPLGTYSVGATASYTGLYGKGGTSFYVKK